MRSRNFNSPAEIWKHLLGGGKIISQSGVILSLKDGFIWNETQGCRDYMIFGTPDFWSKHK